MIALVTAIAGYASSQAIYAATTPPPAAVVTALPAGTDNGHPAIWKVRQDGTVELCGNVAVGTGRVQCTTPN